jgi:hypothetical protein
MKQNLLFFLPLFLLGYLFSMGQGDPPIPAPNVIPPPPNAAALGKFGEVPVGLFSGTIQQRIDIYNLQSRHLSVPVSIGYASNGVKVDQMDGKLGIDWTLNAGGVITRTVYGWPDEYGGGPFTPPPYTDWGPTSTHANTLYSWCSGQSQADNEYDQFNFNFGGYSGSFIVNKISNQWVATPTEYTNVKFEINTTTSSASTFMDASWKFKLTTPDGIQYFFGANQAFETSNSYDCSGVPNRWNIPTAWYLTKITHPYDATDIINFYYSTRSYSYISNINASMRLVDPNSSVYTPNACHTPADVYGGPDRWNGGYETDCNNTVTALTVKLDSINTGNFGKIIFSYQQQPAGLGSGTKDLLLQSIAVYRPDFPSSPMKSWSFGYYFSLGDHSYAPNASLNTINIDCRSFLTSLAIKDQSTNTIQNYQFSYYDIDGLASRLSFSQDRYGYFNGQNNTRFIPQSDPLQTSLNIPVANFTPNAAFAMKGMLKQVIYPTGGNSQFFYELHEAAAASSLGGLRIQKIITFDPVQNVSSSRIFQYGTPYAFNRPRFSFREIHKNNMYGVCLSSCCPVTGDNFLECDYVMLSSNSIIPLMGRGGYTAYYSNVTEGMGENFENGGIEHIFTIPQQNPLNVLQGQPIFNVTAPNYNYRWSQEKNINYFKLINGSRVYTKKITNTYTTDNRNNQNFTQYIVQHNDFQGQATASASNANDLYNLSSYDVLNYTTQQNWDYLATLLRKTMTKMETQRWLPRQTIFMTILFMLY